MGLDSYLYKVKKIQLEDIILNGIKIKQPISPASARVIEYYYDYLKAKKLDSSLNWQMYLTSHTSYKASIPYNVDEIISENEDKLAGKLELLKNVGYFRKNYFLHTYMVKHYQRSNDDCEWSVAIDIEDIQRLISYCQAIFSEVGKEPNDIRNLYDAYECGEDKEPDIDVEYKIPKFDSHIMDMIFDSDDCKNEPIIPDMYNIIDMMDILEIYDVMQNILSNLKDDEKLYYLSWW